MDESPEWGEEVNPIPPHPQKLGGGVKWTACISSLCNSKLSIFYIDKQEST